MLFTGTRNLKHTPICLYYSNLIDLCINFQMGITYQPLFDIHKFTCKPRFVTYLNFIVVHKTTHGTQTYHPISDISDLYAFMHQQLDHSGSAPTRLRRQHHVSPCLGMPSPSYTPKWLVWSEDCIFRVL
jgi:hypothetical protein